MEKENAILQDRPRSIAVQETLCRNMRMLMMRAGERYKRFRRYGVFKHPCLLDPKTILLLKSRTIPAPSSSHTDVSAVASQECRKPGDGSAR